MSDHTWVYRIRDWYQLFETRGSRKHIRPLARISLSTSLEGLVLRRLLSAPQGATAYGVWVLLLQIAAKTPCRGVLADQTGPYSAPDLALLTGIPESQVAAALELLCTPRIALLEQVPLEVALQPIVVTTPPAETPVVTETSALERVTASDADSPPEHQALERLTQPPELVSACPRPATTTGGLQRFPDRISHDSVGLPDLEEFDKLVREYSKTTKSRQPA